VRLQARKPAMLVFRTKTVFHYLRAILRSRLVLPLLHGSSHRFGQQWMSAQHFDLFHSAITPYQRFELHRSFEIHLPRDRRILRLNLDSNLARTVRMLLGRSVIGFCQAQNLRAEMNVRPIKSRLGNFNARRTFLLSKAAIVARVLFRSDARKKII
jgi:hypothetical protein